MTTLAPSRQSAEDDPSPAPLCTLASPREFSFSCHDGQNWRITQTTLGPTVRHYYYTSAWQVIEERVGSSGVSDRLFLWGLLGVDNVILSHRSGTQYYALSNPDAQVRTLVNASGTVLEHYDYHAFGFVRFITPAYGLVGGTGLASAYDWEILYGGYRRDKDTGFYQVRNRYYHPNLGRWLTRDPVGYEGGLNLYAYVGNNPVNGVDPMGFEKILWLHFGFDTSVTISKDTVKELTQNIQKQTDEINEALSKCCKKLKIACDVKLMGTIDWVQADKPAPKEMYDFTPQGTGNGEASRNISNIDDGGNRGLNVLITKRPIVQGWYGYPGTINPLANTPSTAPYGGSLVVQKNLSYHNLIAHEIGHQAGYNKGNKDANTHSTDPSNIMSVIRVAGQEYDECACSMLAAQAVGENSP